MNETCGHEPATFPLNGILYCARCAPYAWQADLHRGHPDEPPAVPTVRRKRITCVFCGGFAFVAQDTPDAERQACRECRHLGYFEPTTSERNT